ncbi:uracil-DNA glycosylase [Saccharolobus solfataricus]|uniref:Type-4 uracil-DNA glycosylase n=3 Tax=Saccharolobus solfataricus TaxID=2287 RepID=UDGA_SACS2|nr:type-4 uracil-DNA glycosylase [Saccharolobus solfataricus]Q97WF1.1 RecName: Full=Type-4 uracil-DNA glycosylase; AltName: Full=UDG1 [Saccharolobus solfataricus P2]AAK42437.1 DNA polymerase phage SPO1 N-terminal domain homolog [Saccharolobus solfataricus P2]AKA72540.1 uracil-DNA glycosylase [Saccharolobus solfataricus]AKA75239.1 uracil-DNA glycosylase [Saccharolobus solfataricus]AKA77932.1 uracil-DNA glycosylase [Saccharolobus solfataricus]AZF67049.1 uracil-DNA glycosylase [Saccharolobus sol
MDNLDLIADEVRKCQKCKLWKFRKNAVPGEGNSKAEIMFIGEAPGENEDIEGKPFVGVAGKLLTRLINEILGLSREDVFITNLVKCRPPNNRDPEEDEILACSPYLTRQIESIRPHIIITLGRHSTSYLFKKMNMKMESIGKVRGKFYTWNIYGYKILVFPTYHPAAALYNPPIRKVLEEDFRKVKEALSSKPITLDNFLYGSGDKGEKGNSNSGK